MTQTLIERIAEFKAVGLSASEIATIVERPVKQVQHVLYIMKYPDREAERQAAYHAKRSNDPTYLERKREAARRHIARRRGK